MAEIMGGIVRIINRDDPHPDLLKDRLREQAEREAGIEEKPDKRKVMPSKLQRAIVNECLKIQAGRGLTTGGQFKGCSETKKA